MDSAGRHLGSSREGRGGAGSSARLESRGPGCALGGGQEVGLFTQDGSALCREEGGSGRVRTEGWSLMAARRKTQPTSSVSNLSLFDLYYFVGFCLSLCSLCGRI